MEAAVSSETLARVYQITQQSARCLLWGPQISRNDIFLSSCLYGAIVDSNKRKRIWQPWRKWLRITLLLKQFLHYALNPFMLKITKSVTAPLWQEQTCDIRMWNWHSEYLQYLISFIKYSFVDIRITNSKIYIILSKARTNIFIHYSLGSYFR
jgi:hypothetical protein